MGNGEESWARKVKARTELRQALRGCTYGDRSDKRFVQTYIRDLLLEGYGVTEENIEQIIPFQQPSRLTHQDRFEVIFYLYRKRYGEDALSVLIEEYELDEPKQTTEVEEGYVYEINGDDIDYCFGREYRQLCFEEKLDIVVQRVYQSYKGFSVIDSMLEQRIDGISGGVSGISGSGHLGYEQNDVNGATFGTGIEAPLDEDGRDISRVWESVWIFYKGKSIRLPFLSFDSEFELRRICQNIYKYNLPGQLSEASGFKVNDMKDGSRVVVVRPPFAESWAFFVRKFDTQGATLEQLIQGRDSELPVQLLKYLMKGSRITSITGSQGSGKTTLLMALVKHIYASYTLRVQEMSFELNLRKLYSARNILSFRETEYVSGQAGLDLQKKTDGTVHILGEVATDEVASWMIQMAQVASLFTVFTHHAKTFPDLVDSLRNSLLKTGVFRDERVAELQVAGVIDFDIHLRRDIHGNRYIERITECCRRSDGEAEILTGERTYQARTIVEYVDGQYRIMQPITEQCRNEMRREMLPEDALRFEQFLTQYWGEQIGA
ncbi:ATPase, T2SS/T4P/T4SS family [Paenibacillus sp. D2_2]|nr:ATPase, T2SS/T4P/T4SS family [Paenibacillus sp. D2_2]WMT42918.1 ATPase, T2SS/T4P/T4SS family [Paenibacillus sp. D2_2]